MHVAALLICVHLIMVCSPLNESESQFGQRRVRRRRTRRPPGGTLSVRPWPESSKVYSVVGNQISRGTSLGGNGSSLWDRDRSGF